MKRQAIERLLPRVFQRTIRSESPLSTLLDLMEALHAPCEKALGDLDATLNARRTPDPFVPYLAGWVDLDRLFDENAGGESVPISSGMGRLRELVASAAWLSQWRGTGKGMVRFLVTATGLAGFSIEEAVTDSDGNPRPFHIRVRGPKEAQLHARLLHRIIRSEKPAYVSYELILE